VEARETPLGPAEAALERLRSEDQLLLKNRALDAAAEGITIADARRPGRPLIFVNAGFERLTGYRAAEVLGRNCKFLQGPDTDPVTSGEIRRALDEERDCTVEILNYRRSGERFWNRLSISPVRDQEGRLTHFIGIQSDVTARRLAEEGLRRATSELGEANLRMRRDLEAAARIQRSLLPVALPRVRGFTLAWAFQPCDELAGDTLNVIRLDPERVGLYVLDVSGHGVPAALLSVTLSHTLSPVAGRSCLFSGTGEGDPGRPAGPGQVAERLNLQFPMELDRRQYFTMVYGVLEEPTRTLRYVSAGHPPPVLVSRQGGVRLVEGRGFPVGMIREARYEEHSLTLEPGDRLVLYTDGLVDALANERGEGGEARLAGELERSRGVPLSESLEAVKSLATRSRRKAVVEDDISLLALEADRT